MWKQQTVSRPFHVAVGAEAMGGLCFSVAGGCYCWKLAGAKPEEVAATQRQEKQLELVEKGCGDHFSSSIKGKKETGHRPPMSFIGTFTVLQGSYQHQQLFL